MNYRIGTIVRVAFSALLFFSSLLGASKTFALELQNLNKCEEAVIKSASVGEYEYQKNINEFLNLQSSQAAAKAKSVPLYLKTYSCDLRRTCAAVQTSSAGDDKKSNTKKTTENSLLGYYSDCEGMTKKAFETKMDVSFDACGELLLEEQQKIFSRCESFTDQKYTQGKNFLEERFIITSSVENQSFLASKIAGMQKRTAVLSEKVHDFVVLFNKITGDIKCTIPY
jgi:hypothetical protein